MRERAVRQGRQWRDRAPDAGAKLPNPPTSVERLWQKLEEYQNDPVFAPLDDEAPTPPWWEICLELLIVADETCESIGFEADNPFFDFFMDEYTREDLASGRRFRRVQRAPFSLSLAAEDLVCVQAKARTPSVGCTLRSLTHHLALLPPRGQVRARWVAPVIGQEPPGEKLGLLLVPFPYQISDETFQQGEVDGSDHWGWFEVKQTWLPLNTNKTKRAEFVTFVIDLVRSARESGAIVNAVVLPELALNYLQFRALADALAKDEKIDFLISGISQDESRRRGNFVAIAPFFLLGRERDADITSWQGLILIREKHHRWKLDKGQIERYKLTNLDEDKSWWENLTILSRSLDFLVYRGNTSLTTLICEDLARVDPCQAVVRAIGPNLLIALLMDGPQIGERWPGRYATVLAEDPGTSVLSLSSFALIARQNDLGGFDQASSVALWKDESKGPKKLELHRDADALALELEPVEKEERSLDGRADGGSSIRWEYLGHSQVKASHRPRWIRDGAGR
ncbi:hypothetical protein G6K86_32285 [Agrobacterium rhizogenes]|nr:hypothetical protein [Rhizobium rhizogenes]